MLHLRLISGSLLAAGIIAVMALDGWLSTLEPPGWIVGGVRIGAWMFNGLLCTLLLLVLSMLAVREVTQFARQAGFRPLRFEAYLFAAGLVIGPYVSYNVRAEQAVYDESWGMLWLAVALAAAFLSQAVRRGTDRVLANLATTLFVIFYCGGLLGFMAKLRMEIGGQDGAVLLLFSMFVVKITDVGAYFTGLLIGRHKAIPWLSPKKTWEGFAGGVLAAVVCSIFVGGWLHDAGLVTHDHAVLHHTGALAAFGVLMAVFSIAGDLAESLLKRDVALKDSGETIPGMGGFLDVVDSALLAAPAAWFYWTRVAPLMA